MVPFHILYLEKVLPSDVSLSRLQDGEPTDVLCKVYEVPGIPAGATLEQTAAAAAKMANDILADRRDRNEVVFRIAPVMVNSTRPNQYILYCSAGWRKKE